MSSEQDDNLNPSADRCQAGNNRSAKGRINSENGEWEYVDDEESSNKDESSDAEYSACDKTGLCLSNDKVSSHGLKCADQFPDRSETDSTSDELKIDQSKCAVISAFSSGQKRSLQLDSQECTVAEKVKKSDDQESERDNLSIVSRPRKEYEEKYSCNAEKHNLDLVCGPRREFEEKYSCDTERDNVDMVHGTMRKFEEKYSCYTDSDNLDMVHGPMKEFEEKCSLRPSPERGLKRGILDEDSEICAKAGRYKNSCVQDDMGSDFVPGPSYDTANFNVMQNSCVILATECKYGKSFAGNLTGSGGYKLKESQASLDLREHLPEMSYPQMLSYNQEGHSVQTLDNKALNSSNHNLNNLISDESKVPKSNQSEGQVLNSSQSDIIAGSQSEEGVFRRSKYALHINNLPYGLLLQIFRLLPLYDLLHRANRVCKKWLHLSEDSSLWRYVSLRGQVKVDDTVLQKLTGRSSCVVHLDISDSKLVTDKGLIQVLCNCPRLKVLKLTRCHQFSQGLSAVGKFCPRIEELVLDDCYGLGDEVLLEIGRGCKQLRFIRMSQCNNVTDTGVEALAEGCRLLRGVVMDHCSLVTDQGMTHLVEKCPHLEQLGLMACHLSDYGVRPFSKLANLRKLDISNISSITKATVMTIVKKCPLLEVLDLSLNNCVDDECMEVVAKHGKNLQRLYLVSCNLTDKALQFLGDNCKQLTSVDLGWCQRITDAGVQLLSQCCPLLTYLGLIRCDCITANTIEELMNKYPNIKYSTFKLESRLLLERARLQGLVSDVFF